MTFRWLKHYMPRSLYARAAIIIVVPVVAVQIVVSVVFLQRHLEDVTTQMTLTAVREVELIMGEVTETGTQGEVQARLRPVLAGLQVRLRFVNDGSVPAADLRPWYDYTGRQVQYILRSRVPDVLAVELPDSRVVRLYLDSVRGPVELILDRRRMSPAAPHQLIVTMVGFGLLMTAIAFLYMRNQLRPVKRLADAAQAFGRGHTVSYSPSGAIEIRAAGSAFLDMRARIERQIEQRTLMLSGVSHDLRTPLTRLKLGLAMIDPEDAAPMLQDVAEMQQMLDAFLDFSRGVSESAPEKVDPVALLKQVVEDARRADRNVALVACEVPEGDAVTLRPTAIRRAVENLIANAVRYGTRAEVSLAVTPKFLRIRVEDDGPGIPADKRAEAVKPFQRLDASRNQNQGGSVGLGLAVVADIARAHGGALRLGDSERLGGLCADIVIGR